MTVTVLLDCVAITNSLDVLFTLLSTIETTSNHHILTKGIFKQRHKGIESSFTNELTDDDDEELDDDDHVGLM